MLRYMQVGSASKEAGGVLLGGHIANTQDIVVDTVTVPMPGEPKESDALFQSKETPPAYDRSCLC